MIFMDLQQTKIQSANKNTDISKNQKVNLLLYLLTVPFKYGSIGTFTKRI